MSKSIKSCQTIPDTRHGCLRFESGHRTWKLDLPESIPDAISFEIAQMAPNGADQIQGVGLAIFLGIALFKEVPNVKIAQNLNRQM